MAIAMPNKTFQPPVKGALPEHLIYANTPEEKLLKALGGAGIQTKSGVPSFFTVRNQTTGGQTEGSVTGYAPTSNSNSDSNSNDGGSDSASSRKGGDGTNFSYNSPSSLSYGTKNNPSDNSSSPGSSNNLNPGGGRSTSSSSPLSTMVQNILGKYGSTAPQATDRQSISQINPINTQISQAIDPARISVDSVGNVPYFNGPHPQPIGFGLQASPADLAASYEKYRSPPGQPQGQQNIPAGAQSWVGDGTQAQSVAQNVGADRNYGSFPPQDMAAGLDPDHKAVYALANQYPNMTATDIMRMASLESASTMNPSVMGGAGGKYRGVFQFGPSEQTQYGLDPKTNPNPTIGQEAAALGSYFNDRGLSKNATLGDAYTVINHGSGTLADNAWRNDNNGTGTIADKVAELSDPNSRFSQQANKWLGNNQPPTQMAMNMLPAQPSSLGGSPTSLYNPIVQAPFNWASLDNGNQPPTQVAAANDQTQPHPIYNADTVVPPAGATTPTSIIDRVLGAPTPHLGPHQTTDVPWQIAGYLPPTLRKLAMALGTPRSSPNGQTMAFNNQNSGNGGVFGGNSQMPIAAPAAGAQGSPQQIQDLVAQLQITTDPVKHAQILAMLRQLDPNTIRYGLQMRQNA